MTQICGVARMTQGQLVTAIGALYPENALDVMTALIAPAQSIAARVQEWRAKGTENSVKVRQAKAAARHNLWRDQHARGETATVIAHMAGVALSTVTRALQRT